MGIERSVPIYDLMIYFQSGAKSVYCYQTHVTVPFVFWIGTFRSARITICARSISGDSTIITVDGPLLGYPCNIKAGTVIL